MTMQVCGYAAHYAKAPLSPFSFDRREPRDHDVAIDIKYSGICHSDIHQVNNGWGGSTFPMVPGHEIAGIVSQVGTKVTRYKLGDRVAVGNFVDSCRKCKVDCPLLLVAELLRNLRRGERRSDRRWKLGQRSSSCS